MIRQIFFLLSLVMVPDVSPMFGCILVPGICVEIYLCDDVHVRVLMT